MTRAESPSRIEPCHLESLAPDLSDAVVELVQAAADLGARLHPRTASGLADLIAMMNCYYSNLIEGHHTRPRDIERALANDLDVGARRNLQLEARAHVRVQKEIQAAFVAGQLPEPASSDFIRHLHRSFYADAPKEMLVLPGRAGKSVAMIPGEFRSTRAQEIVVGRHLPPASADVAAFMQHFERRYQLKPLGAANRIVAIAAAHHRFNYIHPFLDGNGRVSRLMSHAMALQTGIGAHGLWAISRGLARGLKDRSEYKQMMGAAGAQRAHHTDGRGNLSTRALVEFVTWFCQVALDQVRFMAGLFQFDRLRGRMRDYVLGPLDAGKDASLLVDEVFLRGAVPRGEAARITKRPERTARETLRKLLQSGLLSSATPKGDVMLRFGSDSVEFLFPRLFPTDAVT